MKEYKLVLAYLGIGNKEKVNIGFRAKLGIGHQPNRRNVEMMMQEMNQKGWEVVSVVPTDMFATNGEVLITFERKVNE